MNDQKDNPNKAERFYKDLDFLNSPDARSLRILSEYYGPEQRFSRNGIEDTIVFFGSARIRSTEEVEILKQEAQAAGDDAKIKAAERLEKMSRFYQDTVDLAFELTEWSKKMKNHKHRYIITSGGGPGIMEAANKGASDAKGMAIGLNITLPFEQSGNQFITPDLNMRFHYFFMRKYWMAYLAKALVVFPGGVGTLDEFFEILTLIQTQKIKKSIPIVLFGSEFWNNVINWDTLVDAGTINAEDLKLFHVCDTVKDAYDYITTQIMENHLQGPNF